MSLLKYTIDPEYPDRYNRSEGWVRVLPRPGRLLQTSEITEMQSILHDNLKQGMNTLFINGSPLKGLRVGVSRRREDSLDIVVTEGQLYVEGIVLEVTESRFTISPSGTYNIGVLVEESIITENEDPSLRDPIKGGAVYGTEGAARLVWSPSIVINNDNAFIIGQVIDGVISQKDINPLYNIESRLSKYTHERAGNFCVCGYDVTSLEGSKKAVSDKTKYESLKKDLTNKENELQEVVTEALGLKTVADNLKTRLQESIDLATISPTSANLAQVADLELKVIDLNSRYNDAANLVVVKQTSLNKAEQSLSKAENLLVDKEYFYISPGISYIEGYRVSKTDSTTLAVPKDLPTNVVDSARFTYSGQAFETIRQLSIVTPFTFEDIKTDNTLFNLFFLNVSYNNTLVDILLTLEIKPTSIYTTIEEIVDLIIDYLNRAETNIDLSIVLSCSNTSLSIEEIKRTLKNNLTITKAGNQGLRFTSTSLNEQSSQITIISLSKTRDDQNAIVGEGKLKSDVTMTLLSGAGISNNFQLGFRPVAEIIRLVADLEEKLKPIVRGITPGTFDNLSEDSIIKITKVTQGNTVYLEGIDYKLINQSQIDWSLPGQEPSPGSSYYVSFTYTQPLVENDDYVLDRNTDSIVFKNRTPTIGGTFTVDYTYHLAKAGVITLNKNGEFSYILSSASQNPLPPDAPEHELVICSFKLFSNKVDIIPSDCRRINVADLNKLANRVRDIGNNIEVLKLDIEGYRISNKDNAALGLYTDGFQDLSKLEINNSSFTGAVAPIIQSITAGYVHKDVPLKFIPEVDIAVHNNRLSEPSFITLPYESVSYIKQERATKHRPVLINTGKQRGKLYISKAVSFFNKPFNGLTPCDYLSTTTTALTRQGLDSPYVRSIIDTINNLFGGAAEKAIDSIYTGDAINIVEESKSSFINNIFSSITSSPIAIRLRAENLTPGSDDYRLYFSNKLVTNFTLTNNTSVSTIHSQAFKAKSDGTIWIEFNVPSGTPCGVHSLEISGPNGYCKSRISIYNNLYNQIVIGAIKSWGNLHIASSSMKPLPIEYTDILGDSVLEVGYNNSLYSYGNNNENIQNSINFPLLHSTISQTFTTRDIIYLTEAGLKLRAGNVNSDMNVYIRSADINPLKDVLGIGVANTYTYSTDASLTTRFVLSSPLILERGNDYAISLEAKKEGFEVFTSEIGSPDLINGSKLGEQLYTEGSLFLTGDGINLTEKDIEDLTYELFRADFNTAPKTIDLGAYGTSDNFSNITYFCLNTRDIVPPYTHINYQYKVDSNWVSFQANTTVCLESPRSIVNLRAILNSSSSYVSPSLYLEGSSVSLYSAKNTSSVVSKLVNYSIPYNSVSIVVRYVNPPEGSIRVFYSSSEDDTSWKELPIVPNSTKELDISIGLKESKYFLTEQADPGRHKFKYKIEFNSTNSSKHVTIKNIITYIH